MKSKKAAVPLKEKKQISNRLPDTEYPVVARIGLIGCGYWGPNLMRNFNALPQSKIAMACDLSLDRLKPYTQRYSGLQITTQLKDMMHNPAIDAVVIATPVTTHFRLAKEALNNGKHVMVEKPLAATSKECEALVKIAAQNKKILMVGHTFEYNPAVLKIQDLLKKGELGDLHYIDSVRVNLGRHQTDGQNVLWDLAPHDISIILRWVGSLPKAVSAWGQSFIQKGIEDVAFVRLEFEKGIFAHIHISWLAPSKIRKITVAGAKRMAIYDDLENVEKLKIADQQAQVDPDSQESRIAYRLGDILSPRLDVTEPLAKECAHFVDCILNNRKPETDGESGLRVVKVLEAAGKSLKKGGMRVVLKG